MTGLVLKNVTKSFKEGDSTVDALKNVSLTVNPGEFIAIIGPSGSGKSTLLSIVKYYFSLQQVKYLLMVQISAR